MLKLRRLKKISMEDFFRAIMIELLSDFKAWCTLAIYLYQNLPHKTLKLYHASSIKWDLNRLT